MDGIHIATTPAVAQTLEDGKIQRPEGAAREAIDPIQDGGFVADPACVDGVLEALREMKRADRQCRAAKVKEPQQLVASGHVGSIL